MTSIHSSSLNNGEYVAANILTDTPAQTTNRFSGPFTQSAAGSDQALGADPTYAPDTTTPPQEAFVTLQLDAVSLVSYIGFGKALKGMTALSNTKSTVLTWTAMMQPILAI